MKKKAFVFVLAILLGFGLVACNEVTTTTTTSGTTTTTTTTQTTTTTTATPFTIALSGLTEVGFLEEDVIYSGEYFDLLEGVHAYGSDSVDYKNNILFQSDDAACQIADKQLMASSAKTCSVVYTVVINSVMARATRLIKITATPNVMEFTETTLWDNELLFGTDYTVEAKLTKDAVANEWYYWTDISTVALSVENDSLVMDQEAMGGNDYSLQAKVMTDIALEAARTYKITMTIDSEVARYINIVVKAQNADAGYDDDYPNILELQAGVHDYEIIFVAPQEILHLNIMTGNVELETDFGYLKFSNFVIYEGPIVIEYTELEDFFTNVDVAAETSIEYNSTTDSNYVREFYYWDESDGDLMSGEVTADGIDVTVITAAPHDYGIQLQWNDMNKAGVALKIDANYKLTMSVNAEVARTMVVSVTGNANALPISGTQSYSLVAGDNEIVLEFVSLYDYFFMKIFFGNYGDLTQTGLFSITDLKLYEEAGAVAPPDPVDDGSIIGNVFGTPLNVNEEALAVESVDIGFLFASEETVEIPVNTFFLWYGFEASGWFTWGTYPTLTGDVTDGKVNLDITQNGPEFYSTQLKYIGDNLYVNVDYSLSFIVYSEIARTINVQVKNAAFNASTINEDIVLTAGYNLVELPFTAEFDTFNMQINLGTFADDLSDIGTLSFERFMVSRPVEEVVGYIDNGDFETTQVFGGENALGWALWTSTGADWLEVDQPEYLGTQVIDGGVLTAVTTQTGHALWACQIQYNHEEDNMTVGAVYKVEFDVNSTVATTIGVQLKAASDAGNKDVIVSLEVGDNHVTVYYVATQAQFRLFMLLGLTDPSTLIFDNFKYSQPIAPVEEVAPYPFEAIANVNGEALAFNPEPIPADTFILWYGIADWFGSWTELPELTSIYEDDSVKLDITKTGSPEFWGIQVKYKSGEIQFGGDYILKLNVNAEVARKVSIQVKDNTFGGVMTEFIVDLVAGDNALELPFRAENSSFGLQINMGTFDTLDEGLIEDGLFVFSAFELERVQYEGFEAMANVNGEALTFNPDPIPSYEFILWYGIADWFGSWTELPEVTSIYEDDSVKLDITKTGSPEFWGIQVKYKGGDIQYGGDYILKLNVNAEVARKVSIQVKDNAFGGAVTEFIVDLVAGDNVLALPFRAENSSFGLQINMGTFDTLDEGLIEDGLFVFSAFELERVQYEGFEAMANVNGEALTFNPDPIPSYEFILWYGIADWFGSWTELPEVTSIYEDDSVKLDITKTGSPEFWGIQVKYKGGEIVNGQDYILNITINAEVARKVSIQVKDNAFGGAVTEFIVDLVAGDNVLALPFTADNASFGLQINMGTFDTLDEGLIEDGLFIFSDFSLERPI